MSSIFGYLLEFQVDFKEHLVVSGFLVRKSFLKISHFSPAIWGKTRHTWDKNVTHAIFAPTNGIIDGVKIGHHKIFSIISLCNSMLPTLELLIGFP